MGIEKKERTWSIVHKARRVGIGIHTGMFRTKSVILNVYLLEVLVLLLITK